LNFREGSLDERVHRLIVSLLTNNTAPLTTTNMRSDYYDLLEARSQLKTESQRSAVDQNKIAKLLKRVNALSFRYFTKEHVWNLCFKYGSTCNFSAPPPRPHTPISLQEDATSCSSSSGSGNGNGDGDSMTCPSPTTTTATVPVPSKMTLYDIWNQTNTEKDLNLNLYLQEFNKWFNSNIRPPARNVLLAKYLPGYRIGTITTRSLDLDEIYLAIPPSVILDLFSAMNDRTMSSLLNSLHHIYKGKDEYHSLMFHLLYEAFHYGSESSYWNYLRLLPSPQDMKEALPLFWSPEEIISRLNPSALKDDMLEYQSRVQRNYQMISRVPLLGDLVRLNVLNEETYLWATAILDSRSIWWNGQRHLVPMLDFINCQERAGEERKEVMRIHSTKVERFPLPEVTSETEGVVEGASEGGEGGSKLQDEVLLAVTHAAWPFQRDEQLFENYGQPNHIYFAYHGFILDSNSNDCAQLRLSLTEEERARIDVMKAAHVLEVT
jgi:hypothetical protein